LTPRLHSGLIYVIRGDLSGQLAATLNKLLNGRAVIQFEVAPAIGVSPGGFFVPDEEQDP